MLQKASVPVLFGSYLRVMDVVATAAELHLHTIVVPLTSCDEEGCLDTLELGRYDTKGCIHMQDPETRTVGSELSEKPL